jgi:hypothetical protein
VLAFYLDEQVPELLVTVLRSSGYDAVTANQLGNKGLHDGRQLLIATNAGRVLVTYNAKEFTLLHRSWQDWSSAWQVDDVARHAGIMLIYSSRGLGSQEIARAIVGFAGTTNDQTNRLVAWNSTTGWREVQ